jgi:hypothetical protein
MRNMKKKLPKFKNEDDERKFWATAGFDGVRGMAGGKAQEARSAQTVSEDDLASASIGC